MTRRCVDRLPHSRSGPIPLTIIRRAKIRPAFHDLSWDPDTTQPRIITPFTFGPLRVDVAAARPVRLVVLLIPIGRPLPDISNHVVESIPIRRKRSNRRRPFKPVLDEVFDWEFALPGVRHDLTIG